MLYCIFNIDIKLNKLIQTLFLQKLNRLKPIVTIVILNYNGVAFLQQFLPSVMATTYINKRVVIADNCSIDNSLMWLKENYPEIQLLQNTKNNGYAGGYNWALKNIESDYYVLLNSDVEVCKDWIEPIIELMEKDNKIAACQPKILSWHNKNNFEYAGASGGYIDAFGYPFCRGRIFDFCENDLQQYNTVEKTFWASGAALFIKSKIFHELGGFDERFFAHMEEIDLCWRIQLAGYSIAIQPASVVYHVGGGTLPKSYQKTFLNFRNNWLMLCKNLTFKEKLFKLPIRFVLDLIVAVKSLFSKDFGTTKAIFNACIAVIKIKKLKNNHYKLPKKTFNNLDGVYTSSIAWQFFINKKKKFSQL